MSYDGDACVRADDSRCFGDLTRPPSSSDRVGACAQRPRTSSASPAVDPVVCWTRPTQRRPRRGGSRGRADALINPSNARAEPNQGRHVETSLRLFQCTSLSRLLPARPPYSKSPQSPRPYTTTHRSLRIHKKSWRHADARQRTGRRRTPHQQRARAAASRGCWRRRRRVSSATR